jgi:hypothetical protein
VVSTRINLLVLTLSKISFWILKSMGDCRIAKYFIQFLKSTALCLSIEEYIVEARDKIKDRETLEAVKADIDG